MKNFSAEVSEYTPEQIAYLSERLRRDNMAFSRYAFARTNGSKFLLNWHHQLIARVMRAVFAGKIKRLVINIPPGFSKTQMCVIDFMSWAFLINPKARFLHLSAQDTLVLGNSDRTRSMVSSDWFQAIAPNFIIRRDVAAKKHWENTEGGRMVAAPTFGQITGERAGRLGETHSGCIIADDPLKAADAYSKPRLEAIKGVWTRGVMTRRADPNTPVVVVMQRLSVNDPSDFLLNGGTGETWRHLLIPAFLEPGEDPYANYNYSHGLPIQYEHPGGLTWADKMPQYDLDAIRESDSHTYAAQFMQRPMSLGGNLFKESWWQFYDPDTPPPFKYRFITADTATKTGRHNDYTVFQCWAVDHSQNLYLIDQLRGKWEAPDMRQKFLDFWEVNKPKGAHDGAMRYAYIEDAGTGSSMPAELRGKGVPILLLKRSRDKLSRAMDVLPRIESGFVFLPMGKKFLPGLIEECAAFTADDTHAHDDQVDCLIDAIDIFIKGGSSGTIATSLM